MKSIFFFSILSVLCLQNRVIYAQVGLDSVYHQSIKDSIIQKPAYPKVKKWSFVTNVPDDIYQTFKAPFQLKNLPGLAVVAVSSALLIWQDQSLLDHAKEFGQDINLNPETNYKILLKVGNTKLFKAPKNINSGLYQMGEGGTSMLLAGGMYIYGKINHDNRSLQAASDLAETFINMGITTQLVKRAFGRQSPFMSTQPGGKWTPFPSFKAYQNNTSNYDGFPSGHLATIMATVTVMAEDYPEKKWIKPVGYTIMGAVGFAMMNTEVHWAGDYPLAIALGYLSGKITTARHKKHLSKVVS